ncbi:hypothetical protein K2Q02_00860 [Patescibacteria group bacterium]|nr:hypothetical protein [Patescibacteria group bacterium]
MENMKVGERGYIEAYNLIVTTEAVFIDRISEVLTEDEYLNSPEVYGGTCLLIVRTGEGLTEDDFEIDATLLDNYDFYLEGKGIFLENSSERDRYVIFYATHFELEIIERLRSTTINSHFAETSLEDQLQEALKKEEFELAAQIQKKLNDLKRK